MLKELMLDDSKRKTIALNAIDMSKRFQVEETGRKWIDIFEHLT